jgi:hypothetical protein
VVNKIGNESENENRRERERKRSSVRERKGERKGERWCLLQSFSSFSQAAVFLLLCVHSGKKRSWTRESEQENKTVKMKNEE